METIEPNFAPGQLVWHKKFHYRGVIVDVDPVFSGSDEWYDQVAQSRPPKDKPWYHVLIHGAAQQTYVAERHLELDETDDPIDHPMVRHFFDEFRDGAYVRTRMMN